MMMECDRDALRSWAERTLEPERVSAIEAHADECSSCRKLARQLRARERALVAALGRAPAAGECPDPVEIARAIGGGARAAIDEHLGGCAECRDIAVAIAVPGESEAAAIERLAVAAAAVAPSLAPSRPKSARSRRTNTARIAALPQPSSSILPWLVPALAAGVAFVVVISVPRDSDDRPVARAPEAAPSAPVERPAPVKPKPEPTIARAPERAPDAPAPRPEPAPAPAEEPRPEPVEPAAPEPTAPPRSTSPETEKKPEKSDEPARPEPPRAPDRKPNEPKPAAGPVLAATLSGGLERRGDKDAFASIHGEVSLAIGDVLRARGEGRLAIKDRLTLHFEPRAQISVIDFQPRSIRLGLDEGAIELELPEPVRGTELLALDELVVKPWGGAHLRAELRDDGLHVNVIAGTVRLENSRGYAFLNGGESMILKKNVPPRTPLHRPR